MRRQPRRRNPRILFAIWFPALVFAAGLATQASLAPDHPDPVVGEFPLSPADEAWTSDPIEVDATVIGLSWQGEDPAAAWVQASEDGETWGLWTAIHDPDDHGPDGGTVEADASAVDTSEAVYVGQASWLRFKIDGRPQSLRVTYVDTTGRNRTLWEKAAAVIDRLRFVRDEVAMAAPDQPAIQPRSSWGGDACRAQHPDPHPHYHYADRVQAMFVHHTIHGGGANSYTAAEVPELLYAICSFHVSGKGWDDIAYNVLIDKFGTVWEGRAGGVEEGVIGAHTGGFNSFSTGVGFIGDHRWAPPTPAAQSAFIGYAAWKLDVHHIDPRSTVSIESLGSTRYPEGTVAFLAAISGHKDVSVTSCPGDASQVLIPQWRDQIAQFGGPKIYGGWPAGEPLPGFQ
ncbi:MAG: N-acetylmuramoyl-L-alanine amidase, partial [Acidimicrobiia bacterium]|nr:N-acetylmuramoyl-L-alanine amidase [Acidimicrobiia bacterium]